MLSDEVNNADISILKENAMQNLKFVIIDEIDMVKNIRMRQFLVDNVPKVYSDLKNSDNSILTDSSKEQNSYGLEFLDHTCQVYDNMLKEITVEILITIEIINNISSKYIKNEPCEKSAKIIIGILLDHTNEIINQFQHLKLMF